MKIDLKKLKMVHWFEDEDGNVYDVMSSDLPNKDYFTYHVVNPCIYSEQVDTYTCHPEYEHENNSFYQAMLNFKWFRKLMKKKYRDHMTFKPCFRSNAGFGAKFSQDCIVAMVNSGDYTLSEAIYVFCNACERCMNVLLYRYLDGKDGYAEHSEEWNECNTVCEWCKDENNTRGLKSDTVIFDENVFNSEK